MLTTQRDSIQEVMNNCAFQRDSISALLSQSRNQNQSDLEKWQNEKKQLQSKIDEWKQKAELAQMELYATKQKVESLTKRVDSLVLASRAMGELLKPIGNTDKKPESSCDCNFYFDSDDNIKLPYPMFDEFGTNGTWVDVIMPIGWNTKGQFAYYSWMKDAPCEGICGVDLLIYDLKSGKTQEILSYQIDSVNESEDACALLSEIKNDRGDIILKYALVSSSSIPMYYRDATTNLNFDGFRIQIDVNGKKARIVKVKNDGNKIIIREIELLTESSTYFDDRDCTTDIMIQGAFFNPLNSSELMLHVYQADPCGGFEGETVFDSFFVTVPIN